MGEDTEKDDAINLAVQYKTELDALRKEHSEAIAKAYREIDIMLSAAYARGKAEAQQKPTLEEEAADLWKNIAVAVAGAIDANYKESMASWANRAVKDFLEFKRGIE